jgi:uncharacterized protein (DUF433 family)/predicted nuclease of predicted toxin-antitoxin system
MNLLERITIIPDVCNGKPTIRGMRISVKTIVEYFAAGESIENILQAYPYLEPDDIKAALEYAALAADTGSGISYYPELTMKFLVDANLPKFFSFFNHPDFLFVADIDLRMSDSDIWKYAIKHELTILTKDSDFFSKALLSNIKPKVVQFRLGRMTLSEMHQFFSIHWPEIVHAIERNYLVVATPEHITILI